MAGGLIYGNQVGAPKGLNQSAPGTFILDEYVRWGQDVLFDRAGYIRRRAPFIVHSLFQDTDPPSVFQPNVNNERVVSVISTKNPFGKNITGIVVSNNTTSRILFYDEDFISTVVGGTIVSSAALDANIPDNAIFDVTQASTGGLWLGLLESYDAGSSSNEYFQYYWYGGYGQEHTHDTTCTLGITGSGDPSTFTDTITPTTGLFDTTKLTAGMFVYRVSGGSSYYLGMIKSASSGSLTLDKDIIRTGGYQTDADSYNTAQTIRFTNVRPYIHNHGRGLITKPSGGAVTSGSVGSDGEGHFNSANISSWALYRANDGEWLGDVASIQNNAALTLSTTHLTATTMNADEYVAREYVPIPATKISDGDADNVAGVFTATYAGYQWFANGGTKATANRVVFSAYHDAESEDLSLNAADSIVIPNNGQIRGMATSNSGLLVFLDDHTYIIRGNYRANFTLSELYPAGCLSAMSIVEYGGGVFWVGKEGIFYYDGATVRNLVKDNLGVYYTDSIKTFDSTNKRIYGFFHKDYLFLSFTSFDSAYNPSRYEPVYADGISTTEAISNFAAISDNPDGPDWDPDFTVDDFLPENNVPIYWKHISMYESVGADANGIMPYWSEGTSYPTAVVTSGSTTVTGLTGMVSPGDVGKFVTSGNGVSTSTIPANTTISSVTNATTIVMSAAATGSSSGIQKTIAAGTYLWGSSGNQYVWGPINLTEGVVFAIYLPTNALSVISNFNFKGAIGLDTPTGLKTLIGVNTISGANTLPKLVDVDSILSTTNTHSTNQDEELIENVGKSVSMYIKGPDFYIQTKNYTFGDPIIRKWFRQLFLDLYLVDGSVRMDLVDNEDNDRIDIQKKRHNNWETFVEALYTWDELGTIILPRRLSPNRSTWGNVEDLSSSWYNLADAEFTRRKKRMSWRYPTLGFRLYQMNDFRPSNATSSQRPHTVMLDSWTIGFKPMRKSRV